MDFRLDSRVVGLRVWSAGSAPPWVPLIFAGAPGIISPSAEPHMRGTAAAIITQLLVNHARHRTTDPSLTANGQDAARQQPAQLEAELTATREQLRLAKADIQALHERLVDERKGHQVQLESAVCFWKERADEARKQAAAKAGGDEPWPPGSARYEAPAASAAELGHSEDLRLWQQQQRTPKRASTCKDAAAG